MLVSRRTFLLGGLGLGALGSAATKEAYAFEVSRHQRILPGLRAPIRIVQLSDLHYGPFIRGGSLRGWTELTWTLRPDLVLVTGDFVDRQLLDSAAPLLDALRRLQAPLGVWGTWGNHDYDFWRREAGRSGQDLGQVRDRWAAAFERSGVHILRNVGVSVRDDLYLAGVDDLLEGEVQLPGTNRRAGPGCRRGLADESQPGCAAFGAGAGQLDALRPYPRRAGPDSVCSSPVAGSRLGFTEGFVAGPAPGFVSRGLGVDGDCPPASIARPNWWSSTYLREKRVRVVSAVSQATYLAVRVECGWARIETPRTRVGAAGRTSAGRHRPPRRR